MPWGKRNGLKLEEDDDELQLDTEAPTTRKIDVKRQYAVALVANVMMLSYGLGAGWPAPALPQLMSNSTSPLPGAPLSLEDSTWFATLITITGIPLGPFFAYICEGKGRKACGYLTAVLHAVGHLTCAVGFPVGQALHSRSTIIISLYISRSILGMATSSGFIFTPLYVREISDDTTRGPIGVLNTVIINVGVLAAYVIGTYCSVPVVAWIYAVPPVVFIIIFYWMPETPVYLLRNGRETEAQRALRMLRGPVYDIKGEIEEIKASLNAMKADSRGGAAAILKEFVSSRASRQATLIMVLLMINQQFSGLFSIISYTVQIFEESGSKLSPYLSSIIVGIMLTVGTIISAFMCNRWGRKILLILSDAIMAITMFGMGLYFYLKHTGYDVSQIGWAPVTCLSLYVIAFNLGLGPINMLLFTELFSPKLVSTALSLTGPIPGISAFIIGKFFHTVSELIGVHSCYWGFASVCAISITFIVAVVPETKNRPLDSILRELEGADKKKQRRVNYDNVRTNTTQRT